MTNQQTLQTEAVCAGIGVHTGERARLTVKPAPADYGIRFVRTDLPAPRSSIQAAASHASKLTLGTTLCNEDGDTVATVEHLLAACIGMGLDNLHIELDGPEVPIMDGSSAVFCDLFREAGILPQGRPRRIVRILEDISVSDGRKWARLSPVDNDALHLSARIDFESRAIGVQEASLELVPGIFAEDIAFARTFGFSQQVEALKARGLARGGSLENAIVVDGDTVVNPEGLRCRDEFVRHKLLDAIGDLALIGGHIAGAYTAEQPGHALNNALVRKVLETPSAWCWEFAGAGLRSGAQSTAIALGA
ncbi:MAG: UDP-3-O-acyl-N-acetylglucosamine deacetylase [Pseudomonadota bacterium]